jgi:hypothetical protein
LTDLVAKMVAELKRECKGDLHPWPISLERAWTPAWDRLPEAVRAGIVAMVKAASGN